MFFLCLINAWHAFVSIIDEYHLWGSDDGYDVSTLLEHQTYLNVSKQSGYNPNAPIYEVTTFFDIDRNQTMVKRSVLTFAQRCDRYALYVFASIYVFLHIAFFFYMYFWVYKRRRLMKIIEHQYLVNHFN